MAGSTPTEAGVLLAVTGIISVPGALIAPLLVARLRNVAWLIAAGIASFALGYLRLLLAPATLTLLWVLLIGSGSILLVATIPAITLARPAFVEDELARPPAPTIPEAAGKA